MSNATLQTLRSKNLLTEPEQFYMLLWKGVGHLNQDERLEMLGLSEAAKDASPFNLAGHYFTEAMFYLHKADFAKTISLMKASETVSLQHGIIGGIMATNTLISNCYRSIGQLDKAQEHIQVALSYATQMQEEDIFSYFRSIAYYQAGEINVEMGNEDSAIELFNEGMRKTRQNIELQGRFLNGLGVIYMNRQQWDLSLEHFKRSLKLIEGMDQTMLESKILSDLGIYYFRKRDFEKSFEYQEASLAIRLERGLQSPAITNYIKLAELCLAAGKTEEAARYGELAANQSEKLGLNIKLYESYKILSTIYDELHDVEKAYSYFKSYHRVKEEVHHQDVIKKVEQLKNQYKVQSAEQEKEIFRLRNVELKAAMDEITQSFRYAQRLQSAILPSQETMKQLLPDSFILFRPKDIVSGDFYWLEKKGEKVYFAVVDCTGHGVPGAMVSVVGYSALNRCVKEFGMEEPGPILDQLTKLVEETFENSESEVKDGMDISLCCFDPQTGLLKWAGANNPVWIFRAQEFIEIKADKQPVGKFDNRKPFNTHTFQLSPGDTIYLFTDGYADQFGGADGKKFKYKQLVARLKEMNGLPMNVQKAELEKIFDDWKGELEQIDDICMLGYKYSRSYKL
jgi:serine phosphatase RsbU (regulator of sigma subunit)